MAFVFLRTSLERQAGHGRQPGMDDNIVNATNEDAERKFLDLDHVHSELDGLFLSHQEALVMDAFPKAAQLLEDFESRLRIHMRHEEELLLPIYEARRNHKVSLKGVGAEVFVLEHKKMLELLGEIHARMRDLASRCRGTTAAREIIALLDQECTFKHLVQHHNLREHNVLYPSLDKLASADERKKLLRHCWDEWSASFKDCF